MKGRQFSAACERNRDPILAVLRDVLPKSGVVLEIASGTGMHAAYFARHLPALEWQPSDESDGALESIEAWREYENLPNFRAPLRLDVTSEAWPITEAAAIFNANMIHISPWASCLGLFRGASKILSRGAPLVLYGPFMISGQHTAASNAAFDESLRERDPEWGVRDLDDVTIVADEAGFDRTRAVPMPANNYTVLFTKR